MNKNLIILLTVISLLMIAILITSTIQSSKTNVTPVVTYTDFSITFRTSDGESFETNNFLTAPSVLPDDQNPGMYFLGAKIELQPDTNKLPLFVATYDKESGSFNVTLLQKPFAESRIQAEAYLKNLLQIDESEMCQLVYLVTVPGYVNQLASGQDYRFSFCPFAVQL
jgi:hypothetical protein